MATANVTPIRAAQGGDGSLGKNTEIDEIARHMLADLSLIEVVAITLEDGHVHAFNTLERARISLYAQVEKLQGLSWRIPGQASEGGTISRAKTSKGGSDHKKHNHTASTSLLRQAKRAIGSVIEQSS